MRRLRGEVLGRAAAGARRRPRADRRPGPARRPRAVRRRGGLPPRRRARARLHARLLPADRRRPGRPSARSRRRTRSTTCSRWAAGRCSRSRSPSFPESLPAERRRGDLRRGGREGARRRAACSRAATRCARRSRSTGSRSSARSAPDEVWTKAGARPGDALYLTKPLGTGLLVHARKQGLIGDAELAEAVGLMQALNAAAADVVAAVRAARGHGRHRLRPPRPRYELATRSGVAIELDAGALPGAPGRARARRRGRPHGRRPPQPRLRRPRARRSTAPARRRSRSPSTRRRRAACSLAFPPERATAFEDAAGGLASRVGRVAAGDGEVRLAAAR